MAKFIFRRIHGRIVPIAIGSVKDATHVAGVSARKITASIIENGEKVRIATLNLKIPHKGKSAVVEAVNVEQKFRGHGISRELFKHSMKFAAKLKKKFLQSVELQHAAQVKIRAAIRPGPRGKAASRFFGTGFGPYGETTKRIKASEAIKLIKNPGINGQTVFGTTMIPKKLRGFKK